jgi:hypothetical protein
VRWTAGGFLNADSKSDTVAEGETESLATSISDDGAITFQVRVNPRARRDAVEGVREGALRVSLTAPPVDGAANKALIALLAKALRVPKRAVEIVRGEGARHKVVRVCGASLEQIEALAGRAIG